ncbi:MAG: sugar dehydrogenase, partial [Gallionella sp.]
MNRNSLQWLAVRIRACGSFGMLMLLCMNCAPAQASTSALTYENQTLTLDGKSRTVRVPKGYRLEFLSSMDEPRMLTFAANGDLFAGSHSGKVYRLPPPYTKPEVLADLGDYPHSVAFRKGEILIAKTDGVYRAPYRPGQSVIAPDQVILLAALPGGGGHNSRTLGVGPDGRVYVSLGIQSNCSDQYLGGSYPFDDRRGGVLVLNENGGKTDWEAFASGLRNPVGFDWQPQTGV